MAKKSKKQKSEAGLKNLNRVFMNIINTLKDQGKIDSITQFAKDEEIQRSHLTRIKNGEANVTAGLLHTIIRKFQLNANHFFWEEGNLYYESPTNTSGNTLKNNTVRDIKGNTGTVNIGDHNYKEIADQIIHHHNAPPELKAKIEALVDHAGDIKKMQDFYKSAFESTQGKLESVESELKLKTDELISTQKLFIELARRE